MIGRHRRVLVLIGLLVCALVCGTSILVWRSLVGAANQETLRHQQVAERVFDELEDQLTRLIDREETRSFLEYRFFYVPPDQLDGQIGLSRSSLSVPPIDEAVVGYFHIDPNGERFTPVLPRDNEMALAQVNGWQPTPEILSVRDTLDTVLNGCQPPGPGDAEAGFHPPLLHPGTPHTAPAPENLAQNEYSTQAFNIASNRRSGRAPQRYPTRSSDISNFEANDGDIEEVIVRNAALADLADRETDVVISPIRGMLADGGHLVLQRDVRIGANTHQQGLALDIQALGARLTTIVLGDNELAPYIALSFNTVPDPGDHVFSHTFAEPFEDLVVHASLVQLPGQERWETRAIWLLAGLLLTVTVLGSTALYRMVTTELAYAQQRTDFVSAVSHELKTPLTSIRLYAEMLREGMVLSEDRRDAYYQTITAESDRLGRLIDNVLELGRLERGAEGGALVAGDVADIVGEVVDMLRPHAEQRGFRLDIQLPPNLPTVRLDRDALTQILVNLLDNGVKFSAEAEDKRLVIRATPHPQGVQLLVRDHGPGVPERQLTEIFEPFFRGERELTRNTRGTGIGLALVRGLAARMDAKLSARNHPEGGLEVTLDLAGWATP